MGQLDIARSKRFAEMGQNGHLPEPVIIDRLSIKVAVPLGTTPQEAGGLGYAIPVISHDLCRLHQRQRHSGPVDIKRPQHARSVSTEPMISLHDMGDRVSGHRTRQFGRGCHKAFKLKPTTGRFGCCIKRSLIPLGF